MKAKILWIRCSKTTRKKFKNFVTNEDFKDYEAALNSLLDFWEEKHPKVKFV